MEKRYEYGGETIDTLLELAQEAKEYAHNPYDEPAEGAAVVARSEDAVVAVPGVLVENGNYNETRTATETAVFNAQVRGYDDIEQLAVTRDRTRRDPLQFGERAVCETYLDKDTPVTVEDSNGVETYQFDSILRQSPKQLAPELAPDQWNDLPVISDQPRLVGDHYKDTLSNLARGNMWNAYNPSSGYDVGAVLLDADGLLHPGNNIEPDKPGTDQVEVEKKAVGHGEETAVLHWQTFSDADPVALAVASRDGGNCCGHCKQVMAEFFPDDTHILNVSSDDVTEHTYREIDPHPFRLDIDA